MSRDDVSYSSGSCGYPLNLTSSSRIVSGISSECRKSVKIGLVSFLSVDLSRFTQVDERKDQSCAAFGRLLTRTDRESFGLTYHRWLNIQNLKRQSLQFPCSLAFRVLIPFWLHRAANSAPSYLKPYGSRLQTLSLDCCFRISDYGISLVGDGCPSLTTISLYLCNITDNGLEALANTCLALRLVNLAYCPHISDSGGVSGVRLRSCSTLVYIDAECCNLEPEGIMSIVSGGGLKFLNIASLSCSNFRKGLEAIGSGFAAGIKILSLRMCRIVTDASIVAIAKGCPQLQE
ncbi:Ribosomal protein L5 B isoform 1 [Hibiscus syriacus]|uniref:Ribosomal protein L5 B isoform 1 n=1 Tax=Hibiscus syriacus TaxID=106335 RepID=A0A6A2XLB0_HIBSY|nr:Ribosomal protein L5 B isoform 1 [Hibiscus syriacus]